MPDGALDPRQRGALSRYLDRIKVGLAESGIVGGLIGAAADPYAARPEGQPNWYDALQGVNRTAGTALRAGIAQDPSLVSRERYAEGQLGLQSRGLALDEAYAGTQAMTAEAAARKAMRREQMLAELEASGLDPSKPQDRAQIQRLLLRYGEIDAVTAMLRAGQEGSEPLQRVVDPTTGRPTLIRRSEAEGMEPFVAPPLSIEMKQAADTGSPKELRAEYRDASKPYREAQASYRRVEAAGENAAGDLALIFGYMKLLDPGSAVRETEFANAQNAAGVPDQIRNLWNRARAGERLNTDQRAAFKAEAAAIYQTALEQHQQLVSEYRRLAELEGYDPAQVIVDYTDLGKPRAGKRSAPSAIPPGVKVRKVP